MYIVKNYLTDETVAIVTRKEDAIAMTTSTLPHEPKLIFVEEKKVDTVQD